MRRASISESSLKPETKIESVEPVSNGLAHDNSDFQKTIAESRAAIEAEAEKPVKRGRGRPKGSFKTRPSSEPVSPHSENAVNPSAESSPLSVPDISKQLAGPIRMLSKIPAQNYKIPELEFDEHEAMACADALNQVLNAFIPDLERMSPKSAAVLGAFITFGSIGFNKYMIFQSKQKSEIVTKPEIQELNSELPKKDASSYFGRQ